MKKFILFATVFLFPHSVFGAVLYQQSNTGNNFNIGYGTTTIALISEPQATTTTGFTAVPFYTATADIHYVKLKRISGDSCATIGSYDHSSVRFVNIVGTTPTDAWDSTSVTTSGDYCIFTFGTPIPSGSTLDSITFPYSADGPDVGTYVLDGSDANLGYTWSYNGWFGETALFLGTPAFQICDSGGCSGGFAPPVSGIMSQTSPTAMTYTSNPVTFTGTYNNIDTYDQIQVALTNTTNSYTLTPLIASTTLTNGTNIAYSFSRNLPMTGNYTGNIRLYDTSNDTYTSWVALTGFALATTTITVDTSDVSCSYPDTIVGNIMEGICKMGYFFFVPDEQVVNDSVASLKSDLTTHFPIGYITDFVSIISTTTASSLTIIDATLPSTLGLGSSQHIELDLTDSLDFILNATSTIFNNSSAPSTETFF